MMYGVDADLSAEIAARQRRIDWAAVLDHAVICIGRGIAVYAVWRALCLLI